MNSRITARWLAGLLLCFVGLPLYVAHAAPFETSSAHVGSHSELETEFVWKHGGGVDEWTAPKLKASVPVLPHQFELKLSGRHQRRDPQDGRAMDSWGDLELEAKWAFVRRTGSRGIDIAIEPKLTLLTKRRQRLGDGAPEVKLPLLVGYRMGRLLVNGEIEYGHDYEDPADLVEGGVLVSWSTTPSLTLGAEVYTEQLLTAGSPLEVDVDAGVKWSATSHWKFDALAGHSLRGVGTITAKLVGQYEF